MRKIRLNIKIGAASGHRRGWFKLVTSVDQTKKNGYAFNGNFLKDGENDLPLGAIVVEQYPTGSAKSGIDKGEAFRVEQSGLVSFATCDDWRRAFLSFRDAVAAALQTEDPAKKALDELLERRKALQEELDQIEAAIEAHRTRYINLEESA